MSILDGNLWKPNINKDFCQFTGREAGHYFYQGRYNSEPFEDVSNAEEHMKYLKRKER